MNWEDTKSSSLGEASFFTDLSLGSGHSSAIGTLFGRGSSSRSSIKPQFSPKKVSTKSLPSILGKKYLAKVFAFFLATFIFYYFLARRFPHFGDKSHHLGAVSELK